MITLTTTGRPDAIWISSGFEPEETCRNLDLNFKVNISRAFHHIPIDPWDIDLLGLQHRDKLYLDLKMLFGCRMGSIFFQKIRDSIRFIMNKHGHTGLCTYIDELIYILVYLLLSELHMIFYCLCSKILVYRSVTKNYVLLVLKRGHGGRVVTLSLSHL